VATAEVIQASAGVPEEVEAAYVAVTAKGMGINGSGKGEEMGRKEIGVGGDGLEAMIKS
jgi:hypothetical protein